MLHEGDEVVIQGRRCVVSYAKPGERTVREPLTLSRVRGRAAEIDTIRDAPVRRAEADRLAMLVLDAIGAGYCESGQDCAVIAAKCWREAREDQGNVPMR